MRPASRVLTAAALTGGALVGPLAAMVLAAGSGSAAVPLAAEAWYRTAPVCALPTGCPPPETPSPYPADTLHVGVQLGAEESRTTLTLDLSALPSGTKPAGGQLRLPLASGQQDGTFQPETAKIQACLVTAPVVESDGSFAKPPAADCATSTPAVFVPAAGTTPAAFTVDLAALAPAWQDSGSPGSLSLLPAAAPAPTDSWHAAFNGSGRTGEGVAPITAAVSYVSAAVDSGEQPPPAVSAPVGTSFTAPVSAGGSVNGFTGGPTVSAPVAAPQALPPAAQAPTTALPPAVSPTVPVAVSLPTGFQYPAVFLLPLLLVGAAGWAGRAMTQDLTPARA